MVARPRSLATLVVAFTLLAGRAFAADAVLNMWPSSQDEAVRQQLHVLDEAHQQYEEYRAQRHQEELNDRLRDLEDAVRLNQRLPR
jgi:hypothetical protein